MHDIDILSTRRCSEIPPYHDIYNDRCNCRLYHWLCCSECYVVKKKSTACDADFGKKAKLMSKSPPIAVWHPYDPKYAGKTVCSCPKLAVVNSSFQAFFDIAILIIPIPIFKTLKLNYNLKGG